MLSKFRKYESKLILFSNLSDSNIRIISLEKDIFKKLQYSSLIGYKNLMLYFNLKSIDQNTLYYYWNLTYLAEGGHRNLIDYIMSKRPNLPSEVSRGVWYRGLCGAIEGKHMDLIQYCILKGPISRNHRIRLATDMDRHDLKVYFEKR